MAKTKPLIIKDSREKAGWSFEEGGTFGGTKVAGLKSGDYAIDNSPGLVVIERKGTVSELAGNLTQDRFERELARLQSEVLHAFIICEFPFSDLEGWPDSANLPAKAREKLRVSSGYLIKRVAELSIRYPAVKWIFAGSGGKHLAYALMKEALLSIQPPPPPA